MLLHLVSRMHCTVNTDMDTDANTQTALTQQFALLTAPILETVEDLACAVLPSAQSLCISLCPVCSLYKNL